MKNKKIWINVACLIYLVGKKQEKSKQQCLVAVDNWSCFFCVACWVTFSKIWPKCIPQEQWIINRVHSMIYFPEPIPQEQWIINRVHSMIYFPEPTNSLLLHMARQINVLLLLLLLLLSDRCRSGDYFNTNRRTSVLNVLKTNCLHLFYIIINMADNMTEKIKNTKFVIRE